MAKRQKVKKSRIKHRKSNNLWSKSPKKWVKLCMTWAQAFWHFGILGRIGPNVAFGLLINQQPFYFTVNFFGHFYFWLFEIRLFDMKFLFVCLLSVFCPYLSVTSFLLTQEHRFSFLNMAYYSSGRIFENSALYLTKKNGVWYYILSPKFHRMCVLSKHKFWYINMPDVTLSPKIRRPKNMARN